tara:strand:+ start:450 stop:638 length:189 start_codon:yes stop_codon:yes gene_type:complete
MEEEKSQLREILEEMDIPEFRKNINMFNNLRWLSRNMLIRNTNHPKGLQAIKIVMKLMRRTK